MLNKLKSAGYKSGSSYIPHNQSNWVHEDELVYRASDGGLLIPLGSGDKVFTKEMSDKLWNMAKGNFQLKLPNHDFGNFGVRRSDINVGDVQYNISLPGVTDAHQFAKQFKEIFDKDIGNVRKMIDTSVHSKYGSMNYRKYL